MNNYPTPDKQSGTPAEQGFALLQLVFFFMLIGIMAGSGVMLLGSATRRGKTAATVGSVENAASAVISWSAGSGRLPDTVTFPTVVDTPQDSWGKNLVYIYDANLTATASGGICGRRTTSILRGTDNVAFVVLSGGDDYTVTSTPAVAGPYGGTLTLQPSDISRVVTLEELKSRAGCYGRTGSGQLRIINNELPDACAGGTYSATIYAEGGVPAGNSYSWCLETAGGALPAGMSRAPLAVPVTNSGGCGAATWGNATNLIISSAAVSAPLAVYPIKVFVRDSDPTPNSLQKQLKLRVKSCSPSPPPPLGSWDLNNPAALGGTTSGAPAPTLTAGRNGTPSSALQFTNRGTFTPNGQGSGNGTYSFEYNQPFSLALWVKFNSLPGGNPTKIYPLISKAGTAAENNRGYYLELHHNDLVTGNFIVLQLVNKLSAPQRWIYVRNPTPITAVGQWYHIVATYDGSGNAAGVKIYVNGTAAQQVIADSLGNGSIITTAPLRLGYYGAGNNYQNDTVMDDITLYNSELTAAQATYLFTH